jgi:proteasome lid subunit RPN8/RPN11
MKYSERKKITPTQMQLELIKAAAIASYPNEMCGILTADSFVHCENVSENPESSFVLKAEDRAKYHNKTIAIVHTHIPRRHQLFDLLTPSEADYLEQQKTGVPWLIFGCDGEEISGPNQIKRVPNKELLNRPFVWLISDCYSLVQDYYFFEMGIELPDHKLFIRPEQFIMANNLFDQFFEEYGFKKINLSEISNGDLVLLDNAGFRRNHLGIYTDGKILHQDGLSVMEDFSHFIGRIHEVLRYESHGS